MERTIGAKIERILADAGYKGHNAPLSHKFRVFTTGQKHRMTPQIKRELRLRAAVEPVIGHIKNEHRMDRNYLAHVQGEAVNAILAATGYNFSLLLKWLRDLLRLLAIASSMTPRPISTRKPNCSRTTNYSILRPKARAVRLMWQRPTVCLKIASPAISRVAILFRTSASVTVDVNAVIRQENDGPIYLCPAHIAPTAGTLRPSFLGGGSDCSPGWAFCHVVLMRSPP